MIMEPSSPRISLAIPTACCVAVAGFAVSLAVGAMVDNPVGAVIARSLLVLVVSWPIGFGVGLLLEHLFRESVDDEIERSSQSESTAVADPTTGLEDVEIVDESLPVSEDRGSAEAGASAAS